MLSDFSCFPTKHMDFPNFPDVHLWLCYFPCWLFCPTPFLKYIDTVVKLRLISPRFDIEISFKRSLKFHHLNGVQHSLKLTAQ